MGVRLGLAIGAALAVGFALRVAAALSGDLWLDEAWSALLAELAGPVGVFVRIHHDNNHPLTSLWLALVGPEAPLLLQRGLSVMTGTMAILVAARIGQRRSAFMASCLAWLFALSPMLVQWSSEARGYAPVTLFLLSFLDLVDRYRRTGREPSGALAAVAALGTLSHVIMLPGMAAVAAWHLLSGGWRDGARRTGRVFGAAFAFAALMIAIVGGSALAAGGMTIGGTQPFTWDALALGLAEVTGLATGLMPYGSNGLLLGAGLVALLTGSLLFAPRPGRSPVILALLLGAGLPLAASLLQPPNVGFARYHLLTGLALLLAIGWRLGTLRQRRLAVALAMLVGGAMLWQSIELIGRSKGDPGQPVALLQSLRPDGATVLMTSPRSEAVLAIAARRHDYPLRLVGPPCAAADFLSAELDSGQLAPASITHCGRSWSIIGSQAAPAPGYVGWLLAADAGLASP